MITYRYPLCVRVRKPNIVEESSEKILILTRRRCRRVVQVRTVRCQRSRPVPERMRSPVQRKMAEIQSEESPVVRMRCAQTIPVLRVRQNLYAKSQRQNAFGENSQNYQSVLNATHRDRQFPPSPPPF